MISVTAVINCHKEGLLLYPTLRSVEAACLFASDRDVPCEILIATDTADCETMRVVKQFTQGAKICVRSVELKVQDLGVARNKAAENAQGKYIAFIDGDDLVSDNWLFKGYEYLCRNPNHVIHPEVCVFFDRDPHWWRHIDEDDPEFDRSKLLAHNYWTALSYAAREIYLRVPYQPCSKTGAFGFEDWHWNCETVALGIKHKVLSGTTHFIRLKRSGSLNALCYNKSAILRPNLLFDRMLRLPEKYFFVHSSVSEEVELPITLTRFQRLRRGIPFRYRNFVIVGLRLWRDAMKHTLRPFWKIIRRAKVKLFGEALSLNLKVDFYKESLPTWVQDQMWSVAKFELLLFPSLKIFKDLEFRNYQQQKYDVVSYYRQVIKKIKVSEYSHIFIVPWLRPGGADLGVLHHVNTLSSEFNKKCLVVTTEDAASEWFSKLHPSISVLEFGRITCPVSFDEQVRVLTRLVLDLRPSVIHLINSRLGWEMMVRYGVGLKEYMKVYTSCFCDDIDLEGKEVGYGRDYLPRAYQAIDAVFSDQKTYPRELVAHYGYDPELFKTLYFPTNIPKEFSLKKGKKVLWAGRVARQKRPELLLMIAQQLPEVVFDLWGTVGDSGDVIHALQSCENVKFKGPYEGFSTLPLEDYGAFLYTSAWDGLPNILLEAASAGLPIVTSNVGGIKEIIDMDAGYIVENGDVKDYIAFIQHIIFEGGSDIADKAEAAYQRCLERHSFQNWCKQLEDVRGYIGNSIDI